MRAILDQYAIPQLFTTIKTVIPATAKSQINIATTMPTQIGLIYGISLTVDNTDEAGNTLITFAQSGNIYLSLKKGSTLVLDNFRLDKLVYADSDAATAFNTSDGRYLPTIIPNTISLDQSYYSNPSALTSATIMLDLWYITNEMVNYLQDKGAIDISAIKC